LKPNKEQLKNLTRKPGVYIFYSSASQPIYVGKARNLKARISSYFHNKELDLKTTRMLEAADRFDYLVTTSELDALLLEDKLIKKYRPRYNINLRDDKQYPYLKLTLNEEWPRLLLVRKKEQDKAKYFGPYRGGTIRETLKLLKYFFPIRWCQASPLKKRKQPCLYYSMGRCLSPCTGKAPHDFYLALCEGIVGFLEGKTSKVINKLTKRMGSAAAALRFEEAQRLKEMVRVLEKVERGKERGMVVSEKGEEIDWPGLEKLREALKLRNLPLRIEAFDISNLSGTNAVGSMVVFKNGKPLKRDYRRFKIRTVKGPNDVASIREIVERRYTGSQSKLLDLPDLILVDGGKGQVSAASSVLNRINLTVPLFGLAKKQEQLYIPETSKPIFLSHSSPALQLLQKVRDEAHRFAITYHRQKRNKEFLR